MANEPTLDIDDIQGHVLVGFRGAYQRLLGLRLDPAQLPFARAALLPWVDQITSTRQALVYRNKAKANEALGAAEEDLGTVLVALAFTAPGMRTLGATEMPDDPDFQAGAGASAASLSDPVDPVNGVPLDWLFGDIPDRTPDLLAIFGGDDAASVRAEAERLLADLSDSATVVADEWGQRLPDDKEHFGFVDGISQPAPRGLLPDGSPLVHRALASDDPSSNSFARPGRPLVWPGQYLFGYPTQQADSLAPGPIAGVGRATLRNGSLLVLRRLRQDVTAFQDGMEELAQGLSPPGVTLPAETAAAWTVGRWPDGSPLPLAPTAPDAEVASDAYRRNGFLFARPLEATELTLPSGETRQFPGAPADPNGHACPFFAHIRQVNPRDDPVDFGGSGITRQSQMLRRGIPYGPAWPGHEDEVDRGLLFLAYQTSISNQFHRLIKRWVNDNFAPLPRAGIDPLIGTDIPPGRAMERRFPDGTFTRHLLDGAWVQATGGVYAFAPGIGALRALLAG